jgi:hypothetical protein
MQARARGAASSRVRASASSSLIATAGGVHTPYIQRRTVRLATPSSLARSSCVSPVVASNTASRAWGSNVVVLSVSSHGWFSDDIGVAGGSPPCEGVGVTCASRETAGSVGIAGRSLMSHGHRFAPLYVNNRGVPGEGVPMGGGSFCHLAERRDSLLRASRQRRRDHLHARMQARARGGIVSN